MLEDRGSARIYFFIRGVLPISLANKIVGGLNLFRSPRLAMLGVAFLILALVSGCSPGPDENGEVVAPDENGEPEEVDFE